MRPGSKDDGLSQMAYNALAGRVGTVLVVDPTSGRIRNRIAHSTDVQFETSPFELAQIVTAYIGLDSRVIDERTLLPCEHKQSTIDVVDALAENCTSFFRALSRKTTAEAFARGAATLGFVYYGIEASTDQAQVVRPIPTRLPPAPGPDEFAELAAFGQAMIARDLHFANLVATISSGKTPAERFASYITTTARGPAPLTDKLNLTALAVIRRGLIKAVDAGDMSGAATSPAVVAAKAGSGRGSTVLITFAPASMPEIALVVRLAEGDQRAAADVAGRFFQAFFKRK